MDEIEIARAAAARDDIAEGFYRVLDAIPQAIAAVYASRASLSRPIAPDARTREVLERWSHKNEGTPQTHEFANRGGLSPLLRLMADGKLTAEQVGWGEEIRAVADMIERDVSVRIVSYEPRIDCESAARDVLVESILWVRREIAYGWWRKRIPRPHRAVLDMLTGEMIPHSQAAMRHRMRRSTARTMLIDAIDLWPEALEFAYRQVDEGELIAAHAGLM